MRIQHIIPAAALLCAQTTFGQWVGNFTETYSADVANWCDTGSQPLLWVGGGGPAGDTDAYAASTNINFVGVNDGNFRLVIRGQDGLNSSGKAFSGNWLTNQVYMFTAQVRHNLGVPAQIGVRLASANNNPGASIVPAMLLPSEVWGTLVIPIHPQSSGLAILNYGSGNFTSVFSSIGNIQVLLYAPPGFGGSSGPFRFDIDNPSVHVTGPESTEWLANAPDYDRWMYPFNASSPPGSRPLASTFGAVGEPDFDERDAQAYFAFLTAGQIPDGLGPDAYEVLSCRMEVSVGDGEFTYDPTPDAWTSYLPTNHPGFTADADSGRPIELFGAGYRNGFNALTFGEDGFFSAGYPLGKNQRNVFAAGFKDGHLVDVSNSIDPDGTGTNGYDPVMMAVGTIASLTPGDIVPIPSRYSFQMNLENELIAGYIRQALHDGVLPLTLTSLHSAGFMGAGPVSYPVWDQKENVVGEAASLHIEYRLRPDLALTLDEGVLAASWNSDSHRFQVESSASMTEPVWRPVASLTPVHPSNNVVYVLTEESTRFLRLLEP